MPRYCPRYISYNILLVTTLKDRFYFYYYFHVTEQESKALKAEVT